MKKRWLTPKYRRYQQNRQRYEAKRRAEYQAWRRRENRDREGKPAIQPLGPLERELKAPEVFSMMRNPEGMNRFFTKLIRERDRGHTVFVDLSDVKELTFDAIAVLLARISEREFRVGGVRGNEPSDPQLRDMLMDSGFYGHISRRQEMRGRTQRGEMIREGGLKAVGQVAQRLRQRVSAKPLPGVYRILVDSMNNTFDHATPPERRRPGRSPVKWWASTYRDPRTGVAYFVFLDHGMGILKSLNLKGLRALAHTMGLQDDAAILRAVFDGKIESRTAMPNRGRGLPGIRAVAERGAVRRLKVITNNVFADVSEGEYRTLAAAFAGTLFTWEVDLE